MILGTGKPVSHEIRLATWRYVDDSRRMTAICLNPKGKEINVRPESGGYPKGDAEVVDEAFHHAPGHGVDISRPLDREFDFHRALERCRQKRFPPCVRARCRQEQHRF